LRHQGQIGTFPCSEHRPHRRPPSASRAHLPQTEHAIHLRHAMSFHMIQSNKFRCIQIVLAIRIPGILASTKLSLQEKLQSSTHAPELVRQVECRPSQAMLNNRRTNPSENLENSNLKQCNISSQRHRGEALSRAQVHLELKDALLRPTVQRPSILTHGKTCRPHTQSGIMSSTRSPQTHVELVRLSRLASVAEPFTNLRQLSDTTKLVAKIWLCRIGIV
jgi:hypothetical protein